jgi:2-polyprenyl-6-methoxyphenol hydroxylase-like FAD-dependent oxidoreductase
MLAGELALAGVDVAIVERRDSQDLPGSRAGGLHSRTIEVLDQRGIADRFLAEGETAQVAGFAGTPLDISDFPTRHNYGLGLWQNHIERILAGWVGELAVPIYRRREVAGFAQDDTGVDVALSEGQSHGPNISSAATEDAVSSVKQPASSSGAGTRQPAA